MNYSIIRSKRKTLCLEIDKELNIKVRAPYRASDYEIEHFVHSHEGWVKKHLKIAKNRKNNLPAMPEKVEEKEHLKNILRAVIPKKVEYYSSLLDLYPTGIKYTSAKTRFGSCNGKNSLCFSCMLALYPEEAVDYVVVHELCHIKYKNHSKEFYNLISTVLPDYKEREKILKYGTSV